MFAWVGKEADDVIVVRRVVLAELRPYWPSCPLSAVFVTHMNGTAFTILLIVN